MSEPRRADRVDAIVIGSGASGVHAAFPLVEAGLRVRMLDVGARDDHYAPLIPDQPFPALRRSDPAQSRYVLGDRFEGVGFGSTGTGAQLTPPRQFVHRDAPSLTPIESRSFFPFESLAVGGCASAWGAGCPPFDDADLAGMPIGRADLDPHYATVAERIGVSGAGDDLAPVFGPLAPLLPAVAPDDNARGILERYARRRASLNRRGFLLGAPRIAMLSRPHRGRAATRYHDLDFYADHGRSVWRPRWSLDELRAHPNFEYRDGLLVSSYAEDAASVEIRARRIDGSGDEVHAGAALVLAAGALGTARIVLRSTGNYDRPLPIVCNPHTYAPMLNVHRLGAAADDARHSLAQLCVVQRGEEGRGNTVGHIYSYRSLLTFRLLRESPLAYRESLAIFRALTPAFTILIVQHADAPTAAKRCILRRAPSPDQADRLDLDYALAPDEERRADRVERGILAGFRALGCYGIRRVHPGHAASVHYAGTLPMTTRDQPLTTDPDGRLRGTRTVFVADGSVFPHLPSKGLTFTMMANADRVGTRVRRMLGAG